MNKEESRLKSGSPSCCRRFFLDRCCRALPLCRKRPVVLCSVPVRNSFLCRLFPGRGILHATYRHARATVDVDYVYLVAFREKQVLVVQILRSIDRTFGARTEQVTFGEIPGHQRSDVFPARIACPGIGEEGAAEFTVHGDKRFQIRPGRKVPSFRTNALHALDIAEVIRSNRFPYGCSQIVEQPLPLDVFRVAGCGKGGLFYYTLYEFFLFHLTIHFL